MEFSWDDLKPGLNYVAMDACGEWWAYTHCPEKMSLGWSTGSDPDSDSDCFILKELGVADPIAPSVWWGSLMMRPNTGEPI